MPAYTHGMSTTLHAPDAFITDTDTRKGRGVFAARSFRSGEIVEACPVIVLTKRFSELDRRLQLVVFDWGTLSGTDAGPAVALGFGSLYNHAEPANMTAAADTSTGSNCIVFRAVRDVEAGEELTINYNAHGGGHTWHDSNWFDRMGIEPIG